MVGTKTEVEKVGGECSGGELDRRIVRCAPVVRVVFREAAGELFQFVAARDRNLRRGRHAERIETRCNLASQRCDSRIAVNLAFNGSNHIPETFGASGCAAETSVCILDDFMKCEVAAYVPETPMPRGSVSEELAEPREDERCRYRVIDFLFRHCSDMLAAGLDT